MSDSSAVRSNPDVAAAPMVMFAVPRIPSKAVSSAIADRQPEVPVPAAPSTAAPFRTVPLIEPDASPLQNLVQSGRQRFLDLMGGSRFWRVFVGGGFAVLVGAVTLIVLEPRPDQAAPSPLDPAAPKASVPLAEEPPTANPSKSEVQLVVNEIDGTEGQPPAQHADPFVEENLVTGGVQHAVHEQDHRAGATDQAVRQVSNQAGTEGQSAWLSGTIEADDERSQQPMRNHERSRPSYR